MKRLTACLFGVILLLSGANTALGGATIYGLRGLIEVPDDTITPIGGAITTANGIIRYKGRSENMVTLGASIGVLPNLEIGGGAIDSDRPSTKIETLMNAKYRIFNESRHWPSVSIGVVDLVNQLDKINADIHNSSGFVTFGKNFSCMVNSDGITSEAVKVVAGFGTGLYKGGFAGVQWHPSDKTQFIVEYLTSGIRQSTTFSAAARFNVSRTFDLSIGTLGFDSVYAGGDYSLTLW